MSPIAGANPLDYDATYPQVAGNGVNEKAKIEIMERNIGREAMFQIPDGTQYHGKINYVPNCEHYCVVVNVNKSDLPWEWYVREDSLRFVDDVLKPSPFENV